jgi:uncharacterized protein with NRDE domain
MCIVAFDWRPDAETALLLASNRDEFYARPAAAMHWWPGDHVLAGRDLQANGAWLGMTRSGRFALVTNIRNPALRRSGAPSRGGIVSAFLTSAASASAFIADIAAAAPGFEGFNLLCGQLGGAKPELWFLNSTEAAPTPLGAGLYGLSNASLDTPWPKLQRIKQGLRHALAETDPELQEARLLRLLRNMTPTPAHLLPDTGVPAAWEQALGSIFIHRDGYGTRASTVLRAGVAEVAVTEANFGDDANVTGQRRFRFAITASTGTTNL